MSAIRSRLAATALGLVFVAPPDGSVAQGEARPDARPDATPIEVEIAQIGDIDEPWYEDEFRHRHKQGSEFKFSVDADLPHGLRVRIGSHPTHGTATSLNLWRDESGRVQADATCSWWTDHSLNGKPTSGELAGLRGTLLIDRVPFASPGLVRCRFLLTGRHPSTGKRVSAMGGFQIDPASPGPR